MAVCQAVRDCKLPLGILAVLIMSHAAILKRAFNSPSGSEKGGSSIKLAPTLGQKAKNEAGKTIKSAPPRIIIAHGAPSWEQEINATITKQEDIIKQKSDEIAEMKVKFDKMTKLLQTQQSTIEQVQKQFNKMQEEAKKAKDTAAGLKNQVEKLQQNKKKHKKECAELEALVNTQHKKLKEQEKCIKI